jgi:hypothetical protein
MAVTCTSKWRKKLGSLNSFLLKIGNVGAFRNEPNFLKTLKTKTNAKEFGWLGGWLGGWLNACSLHWVP